MNRQEYIDTYVGNIDIGDTVVIIEGCKKYKEPITGRVLDIFLQHSIKFTLGCTDADGRRFQYHNASLESLEKVESP